MLDQRYSDNESSRRDIPSFIESRPPLIQNPFMRPRPQKGIKLLEQFEQDSEPEEPELVQVYLRMKPCDNPSNLYEVRSNKCLVTCLDTTTAGHGRRTQHNVPKMYTFSRIFESDSTQKEIFEQVVKENLKKLPEGQSFTLLTYGASGSGKTYTLMGRVNSPGLVPRSLEYVFKLVEAAQIPMYKPSDNGAEQLGYSEQDYELQWVKRLRHVSAPLRDKYRRMSAQLRRDLAASTLDLAGRTQYYVWVSFVEIYNEAIYDLLAPPEKRTKLKIREDSSGNVYVKDVTQAFVRSGEEAYDVLVAGKHNLVVAATGIHAHSSRSHCIFTITMLTETGDGEIRTSHVRLCDLAGCERQRAARNTGARMQESRAINSSLHVLERCLHMLRRKQKLMKDSSLVPYRESKLTRLLGSGLSGSRGEAVSMVVTVNPSPQYAYETKHVLSLAAVAQDIQVNNTLFASTLESSGTQDTTVYSSAELMKLRSDNERLHFELVQAQARNKELAASMEEEQQSHAETMRQLLEDAKDMMRQYYEPQIEALKAKMDEMIEEYESRLAKQETLPTADPGTPSRFLQNKVAQLMTEITVLEDQLSEEKLARARAEKEVQHLRTCIEERDEKAFKESSLEKEEVVLTDSDQESDEDTSDPFNESLEPIFKKESTNRSYILHNQVSTHIESKMEDTVEEETIELDKSNNTLTHDSIVETKDSVNVTNNDRTNDVNENKDLENTADDPNDKEISAKYTDDSVFNDTHTEKDKSEWEQLFQVSTQLNDDTNDEIIKDLPPKLRGTYYVENKDSKNECFDDKEKNHALRGTYFVEESVILQNKEKTDDVDVKDQDSKANEFVKPKKLSETFVNKIVKSLKLSQNNSEDSLRLFEQLEMAADNCEADNTKEKSVDFGDIKILREKRTYFDDNPNEVIEDVPAKAKYPAIIVESVDSIDANKDNISNAIASPEKHEKSDNLSQLLKGNSKLSPNKENQLYFSKENSIANDILLSSSTKAKRSYFEKIDGHVETASNKNIDDFIVDSLKDNGRSPSIVKDVLDEDYEVKTIKEHLRESLTKPHLMPSIHKNKVFIKKQDSLDIFESPQIIVTKVKEDDNFQKALNVETIKENDNIEIASPIMVRELSNVEIVRKSIERLVLEQKSKADTKETKIESSAPVKEHKQCTATDSVEIIEKAEEVITVISEGINDTQSSKSNNTLDEFEKIAKDLSNIRPTQFDLLISQEINEAHTENMNVKEKPDSKPTAKPDIDNKPDEIKYNLRHKGQSNLNISEDKEEKEDFSAQTHLKLEMKAKTTTKKSLRLRRRKKLDNENSDPDNESKLKDIINLKKEFSDVTMGVPAVKKQVKDIPSPEKLPGQEENLPPMIGIQSCPSKSVTRSRRKLFTPRAEPLEESLSQAGDSNERVYVPRPSYQRPRARRKL